MKPWQAIVPSSGTKMLRIIGYPSGDIRIMPNGEDAEKRRV